MLETASPTPHRIRWYVYAGGFGSPLSERIPKTASMRGTWAGYDATCSCGWDSRSGGALRREIERQIADHRDDVASPLSR